MEADQLTTMFITPFGSFYYVKMLFGLKNAWPPINGVCSSTSRGRLGTTWKSTLMISSSNLEGAAASSLTWRKPSTTPGGSALN
jgi:hypothetical protein